MPVTAPAAFPFIEVNIDTKGLQPVAQRSPGVIAVVGTAAAGSTTNQPTEIGSSDDAKNAFGATSTLKASLDLAMLQDPKPSKIYGVACGATTGGAPDYAGGLESLEGVDDVAFVSLASEPSPAAAKLGALKTHVEATSAAGNKRIGFGMIDPATARSSTYVSGLGLGGTSNYGALKSSVSRMVLIAPRGAKVGAADADAATAAMAAVAGYLPHISAVLKPVRGLQIDPKSVYGPTEIKQLSEGNVNPIIDPAMIPGASLHLAEGRCFTSDESLLYIDIVRTLDDIEFRLKAGLIGSIGDARITKAGMTTIKVRIEAILGVLLRNAVIDDFSIQCPVLEILSTPEASRTSAEAEIVRAARQTRSVEVTVVVKYGPAVHRLLIKLAPAF